MVVERGIYGEDRKQFITQFCNKFIDNYKINKDFSVDVDGDVDLINFGFKKLPINFNYVSGDFKCNINELITLEGSPRIVGGSFMCNNNKLTSLIGAPLEVREGFFCGSNQLTSLEGISKMGTSSIVGCDNNNIYTLKHYPFEARSVWFSGPLEPIILLFSDSCVISATTEIKQAIELFNEFDIIIDPIELKNFEKRETITSETDLFYENISKVIKTANSERPIIILDKLIEFSHELRGKSISSKEMNSIKQYYNIQE